MIGDEETAARLEKSHLDADLDEMDREMLDYAAKLTLEPWNMTEGDVIRLRESGFSDSAILDICQVAGYFAFVNRLADGLGVELEDYWQDQNDDGK